MSLTNFQIETLAKLRLLLTLTAVEVPDMPDPENWEANVLQLLDLLALGINNIQAGAATSLPWSAITEKPTAFPPETHSHQWSQIQNKPSEYPPESHQHGWTDLTGIPASFPPSLHTHPEYEGALTSVSWADVTGKPLTFPPDTHTHVVDWLDVQGKPSTFAPAAHDHLWANITDRPTSWPWADIEGKPTTFPPDAHSHAVTWASVEGKPTTFPPDAHSHGIDWGDLTGRPANLTGIAGLSASLFSGQTSWFPRRGALAWSALAIGTTGESLIQAASGTEARTAIDAAPAAHTHDWAGITGKPSTFAPAAHTHDWAGITGKPDLGTAATVNTGTAAGEVPLLGTGGQLSGFENASIELTERNSFTLSGAFSSLRVIPISRLAILTFVLDRATTWSSYLEAVSWVGYAPIHDVYLDVVDNARQIGRVRVLSGTSKLDVLALGVTTFPMAGLLGQVMWTY